MTQSLLASNIHPSVVEELDVWWCKKLLEGPASGEPATVRQCLCERRMGRKVRKVDVADRSFLIPLEHGVDRLGELSGAFLHDTARIDPEVLETFHSSLSTTATDFVVSDLCLVIIVGDQVLKAYFLVVMSPRMTEDRVRWCVLTSELNEAEAAIVVDAKKTHGGR